MKQPTPRRDSHKQAATARRLQAGATIAPHVLQETVVLDLAKPVLRRRARATFQVGSLVVQQNEYYYLVSSKFLRRFYIVAERDYRTSASDSRVAASLKARARAHHALLSQQLKAA